jgi:LuxR family maltose regulon positive regulatory protein
LAARSVIATTKFAVPSVAQGAISRPQLTARLDESVGSRLTLVSAPAGSGKTTLLVEWIRSLTCPFAWLSCDLADSDPQRFWQSMAMTLHRTWPSVGLDVDEFLEAGNHQDLAISLANDLDEVTDPGVIVIDDYHLAHPYPREMSAFMAAVPSSTTLVVGTRSDPPFALAKMRVHGDLYELRQHDLRLEPNEVEGVLRPFGVELAPDELAQLCDLTEGWTAGAVLAAIYLQSRGSGPELLRGLVATDRSIVDFLVNEVIDGLPDELLDFLLLTGELEVFDLALCDAVMASPGSIDLLREVRHRNLFLVELDRDAGSYRYHHLFGRFLQARLRSVAPERVTGIHLAAADAYAARGDPVSAVRHSMAAADVHGALRLLNAYHATAASPVDYELAISTARRWLHEYGVDHLDKDPIGIYNCLIILNATTAPGVDFRWWLEQLEARLDEYDVEARTLYHGLLSAHALNHLGDPELTLREARIAEASRLEHGLTNPWVFQYVQMLVQALIWLDDLDGAEEELRRALTGAPRPAVVTEVRVPGFAAHVAYLRGELDVAEQQANEAYAAAERLGLLKTNFGLAEPALIIGGLLAERGRFEEAEASFEELLQIVEQGRRPMLELLANLALGELLALRGEFVVCIERLTTLQETRARVRPPVRARIDQVEARVALRAGELAVAEGAMRRLPPGPVSALLESRLALARGDTVEALGALGEPDSRWSTRRLRLERCVVSAMAADAGGDRRQAHDCLREAVVLAEPVGFQQIIIGEGPRMWQLLESLSVVGRSADYVRELLRAASRTTAVTRPSRQDGVVEPLSEREITVLRYLSSRLTAPDIASALFISGNTVRSHVKAIYRKLGVNSRTDAVERGRELGLLAG